VSQADVELIQRCSEAFYSGDLEAAAAMVAADAVFYRDVPDASEYRGFAGFLAATAEWTEGFDDHSIEPREFVDTGERVLVEVVQRGRGRESGVPLEEPWWFVYTVRDGKIERLEIYAERAKAREAAGLGDP
jgi:ketosteroid isomerase-like protein